MINNKNTYIRIKEDKVVVTTNYLVNSKMIDKLINDNKRSIITMIDKYERKVTQNKDFMFLGKKYDIIYGNLFKSVDIGDNKIYVKDEKALNKYLNKYMRDKFLERLDYNYHRFIERIPYPSLRIRKMTSRWGVCNTKTHIITLNSELLKYDIIYLDYVIIHELSHLIHPNHSKEFWMVVEKYCPNYKIIRKNLRY